MYPHFIDTETGPMDVKVFCPSTYNEFGKTKKHLGFSPRFIILDQIAFFYSPSLCEPEVSPCYCHFKSVWYVLPAYLIEKLHSTYKIIQKTLLPICKSFSPLAKIFHWKFMTTSKISPHHTSYWKRPSSLSVHIQSGKCCGYFLLVSLKFTPAVPPPPTGLYLKVLQWPPNWLFCLQSFLASCFHDVISWLTSF